MNNREPASHDISPEEFRRSGYEVIDWIAAYLEDPRRHPVKSRSSPGEISAAIPALPPEEGEGLDRILDDFESVLIPGITHWNHPGFFAYFATSAAGVG